MERIVRIKTTEVSGFISERTKAETFSDLKKQFSNLNWDGKKVLVRETRVTLEHGDAKLPSGDFTLFITPAKTKAGGKNWSEVESFHELRRESAKRGLPNNGLTRNELVAQLEAYEEENGSDSANSAAHELLDRIEAAVTELRSKVDGASASGVEYTDEELQEDLDNVMSTL